MLIGILSDPQGRGRHVGLVRAVETAPRSPEGVPSGVVEGAGANRRPGVERRGGGGFFGQPAGGLGRSALVPGTPEPGRGLAVAGGRRGPQRLHRRQPAPRLENIGVDR